LGPEISLLVAGSPANISRAL